MIEFLQTWGSLAIAALALAIALRAEIRISQAHEATRLTWKLETDPQFGESLILRNTGHRPAYEVTLTDTGSSAIRRRPESDFKIGPGDSAWVRLNSEQDIIDLPDSVTVTWHPRSRAALWKGRQRRSSVSTTDVRHAVLERQQRQR